MISTPEPSRPGCRVRGGSRGASALAAVAALVALALAVPGAAAGDAAPGSVAEARTALGRGDGIAGEMLLRRALAAGAPRTAIAARMGEAYLAQNDLRRAREWLGDARFAPDVAAHGFRMLGRLEMAERNFAAADAAFARALQAAPEDAALWVDIARLRYIRGDQAEAIAAADRAVQLDPANVRGLELRGLMVRDAYGQRAALPWFEAGLKQSPADLALLGEYAATLGEMGRAREMLTITRHMIALDRRNARAFYLQAVLAARAGDVALGRRLLDRAGKDAERIPGVLLLRGALELQAGNANAAVEPLSQLLRRQGGNRAARLLLARALQAAGHCADLVSGMSSAAHEPGTSPYLQIVTARCLETLGERAAAGELLDRASSLAPVTPIAVSVEELARDQAGPASAPALALAGDLRLAQNDIAGAVDAWRASAAIRMTDGLLLRLAGTYARAGRVDDADSLIRAVLFNSPRNQTALRLAAQSVAAHGHWTSAAAILEHLSRTGGSRDAMLLGALAGARKMAGDTAGAQAASALAARLMPAVDDLRLNPRPSGAPVKTWLAEARDRRFTTTTRREMLRP